MRTITAAVATLATGLLIVGVVPDYMQDFMNHAGDDPANAKNAAITVGMLLGITMAANVWMIIWKNQKVVIANAVGVLEGKEANPDAATAGRAAWRPKVIQRRDVVEGRTLVTLAQP